MSGYNMDYETAWVISLIFKINTNIYVYAEIILHYKKGWKETTKVKVIISEGCIVDGFHFILNTNSVFQIL